MDTKADKKRYKELKSKVEKELRNYPYYVLALESSKIKDEKEYIVKAISFVYDRLDELSKKIIDLIYFRDDHVASDVMDELMIDKNKFYSKKKSALDKFIVVLDNIC